MYKKRKININKIIVDKVEKVEENKKGPINKQIVIIEEPSEDNKFILEI